MTAWRATLRCAAALSVAIVTSAHVGSPDVYYSGKAGPYDIDVAIRPPQVVPGIADVTVTVADTTATSVVIRPVFWRAGAKGAPQGDAAERGKGSPVTFTGRLWLMASGSYSVHVTVAGPAGSGTSIVPVASVATGQLGLSPFLKVLLGILGTLLVAGTITAIHAAIGEAQLVPGDEMTPTSRRRARRAAILAVPLMALIVLGGANWWQSEARAYRRTLYRPVPTRTSVSLRDGIATITQTITDSAWRAGFVTPVMPDHGKDAHMFVVGIAPPFVFAHLHPSMLDRSTFVSPMPPLPAGRYRVFTDVVHESGFQRTLVDSIELTSALDSSGVATLGTDDAWSVDSILPVSRALVLRGHEGGVYMRWAGPSRIAANEPGVVRIGVSDRRGNAVALQPYLGMTGHAVVVREDGKVFVHLHPNGTTSMASSVAFAMRDRGDTSSDGRLNLGTAPMAHSDSLQRVSEIRFPYAFPSPGRYRVYAQVRAAGQVHTTGFDLTVQAP